MGLGFLIGAGVVLLAVAIAETYFEIEIIAFFYYAMCLGIYLIMAVAEKIRDAVERYRNNKN